MKHYKILVVDDDPDIVEILTYNLKIDGYDVINAFNGKEAVKKTKLFVPDIILMDVMMPVMNGIEACSIIREKNYSAESIIIFLSARSEDFTQLAAFDAGGDDYITKPVKPKILLKKINSIVKRLKKFDNISKQIQFEKIKIDRSTYTVVFDGVELTLPRKEFELLFLLASHPSEVINRNDILNKVWGPDVIVGSRTIDVHIRKLREKIGDSYFKTVKGVGYKFTP
tara:strand:- start:142 stop:819 length:678 start_codon:yes stop_codon:yes gene_type:complete